MLRSSILILFLMTGCGSNGETGDSCPTHDVDCRISAQSPPDISGTPSAEVTSPTPEASPTPSSVPEEVDVVVVTPEPAPTAAVEVIPTPPPTVTPPPVAPPPRICYNVRGKIVRCKKEKEHAHGRRHPR